MGINERKEREKQMRREGILDAAEKIFFSKGIENSTMDDVAAEAELSKGTLYLYFKSKEEIHWEISQRHMDKVACDMVAGMDPNNNAVDNLLAMANIFVEHFDEEHAAAHSILFFQASDLKKLNLNQDQICKAFLDGSPIHMVQEQVELGIKQGLIRDDIPANALSSTLWAQIMGVLQVVTMKRELFELIHVTKEDIIESHLKIVLNGVLKNDKA